jgi:hypothetical protein
MATIHAPLVHADIIARRSFFVSYRGAQVTMLNVPVPAARFRIGVPSLLSGLVATSR